MNGTALLALLTQILGNESPSQTFMLQLINTAKMYIEGRRFWRVLATEDHSQSVAAILQPSTPIPVPSNFLKFLEDGKVKIWNGQNQLAEIREIPKERWIEFRDQFGYFYYDAIGGNIYILGLIPFAGNVYQYYIQQTPAITINTSWQGFPAQYHPILAYEAAAHWRLGTDYDDTNARNANDNAKMSDMIYCAMSTWDADLQVSAVENLNYARAQNQNTYGHTPNVGGGFAQ